MRFEDALHSMRAGNRQRRASWAGDEKAPDHLVLSDGKLVALTGGKGKAWIPKPEELLADDWEGI